jgi:prepilin-type N-terminal cleavage/methylation domain-containing protein
MKSSPGPDGLGCFLGGSMKIKTSSVPGFTLVEIMIVVAVIGLLAAIAIPNFVRARESSQLNSILNNLRILQDAKSQWAIENRKGTGDSVVNADLAPYLKSGHCPPTSVVGETYTLNIIGTVPTATAPVKLGTYAANSPVALP